MSSLWGELERETEEGERETRFNGLLGDEKVDVLASMAARARMRRGWTRTVGWPSGDGGQTLRSIRRANATVSLPPPGLDEHRKSGSMCVGT